MDNAYLTGPLGTQWNIGSWIDKTAGLDYGAAGLVRQQFGQNAWAEGARLGFESAAGPRRMTFPLIVPSGGVFGLSLDAIEGSLRQMVRPGGFIDLQPANVPTGEMVRFDVLGGDVAHRNYSIDLQRVSRRQYTLSLETQPFGYWPTWMIAGSVASVSLRGGGMVALTQPVGDMPARLEMTIGATVGSQTASGGFLLDGFAWANGGRPSFLAGLGGGSWAPGNWTATYQSDGRGISATSMGVAVPPGDSGWGVAFFYAVLAALEPAYRGRFRAIANLYDSGVAHQTTIDTSPGALSPGANTNSPALASGNAIATTAVAAFPFFGLIDLGEITLPPLASGAVQGAFLRVWAHRASWGATTILYNNGVYLLPLDGQAGVLTRGLAAPTIGFSPSALTAAAGYFQPDVGVLSMTASAPISDLARFHRGQQPQLGATVRQIDLLGFQRLASTPSSNVDIFAVLQPYASVSVRYQPRFQFAKGI